MRRIEILLRKTLPDLNSQLAAVFYAARIEGNQNSHAEQAVAAIAPAS
jgi:hypothetical protein